MANWWDAAPKASPLDVALDAEKVDPKIAEIARSVYMQESGGGKNTKTSNAGAVGGMQIVPATFSSVADKGWNINDPVQNARAGVRYLTKLYDQAGGDPALTAAGYYGGPGGLEKARKGIAVSDPRNPNAPTTLEYGKQVAGRVLNAVVPSANAATPDEQWWAGAPVVDTKAPAAIKASIAAAPNKEEPGALTNFVRGLGHGVEQDLVRGPAQFIGEGLQSIIGRIPGIKDTQYWRDIQANAKGEGDTIKQNEAQYQAATPGSVAAGAGRLGANLLGLGGSRAKDVVQKGGEVGKKIAYQLGGGEMAQSTGRLLGASAGGSALGATTGALAPVTQEGDYSQNKLAQIAMGGGVGAVLPGAGALAGATGRYVGRAGRSLVEPFTEAGQGRIAGNILSRFSEGGPMAGNVAELVPGSRPTLAQVTGNPGLATLERGIQSSTPQGANAFAERATANAQARGAALEGNIGSNADLLAAKAERASNAADDYLKTNVGIPIANTEYAALKETPAFRAAFARAQAMARNAGGTVETTVQNRANVNRGGAASAPEMYVSGNGLQTIKEALDDQINKAAQSGAKKQAANLLGVKERLLGLMDREIPGYADARAAYAEASRPIDAMQFLQNLRLTDAQGNVTLAKVQNALVNIQKQQSLPGVRQAKSVAPEQIEFLTSLRDDLLRASNSGAGKSIGSNTFQNLATNNILENALPGPVRALMGGSSGPVGTLAGKAGNLLYGGANENIQNRLLEMMMNPQQGLAALQNVRGNQLTGPLGSNALLQRLAPNLLPAATVGIGGGLARGQ
jgi:hypothetical protein